MVQIPPASSPLCLRRLRPRLLPFLLIGACHRQPLYAPEEIAPVASALTDIPGLVGEYFDSADLTAPRLSRVDSIVDFPWGAGAPAANIGADTFSVRWTGFVTPRYSETYTFIVHSDDGLRLWVDGTKIIEDWTNHTARDSQGTISLQAGKKYAIKLEYYENVGDASVRLSWSSASQAPKSSPPIG